MDKLFIGLYFDENVDVLAAKILTAWGFDVLTTDQARLKGTSDPEQLQFAILQQRAIVTMNRLDFEDLAKKYFESGKRHFGIILIYDYSAQDLARRLNALLDDRTADEMIDQVIYI